VVSAFVSGYFFHSIFLHSNMTTITLGADVEHVPWWPSLMRYVPTQGEPAMEAISLQPGARVTVALPAL
jgi:hypothetical protein